MALGLFNVRNSASGIAGKEALIEALGRAEALAIRQLAAKITPDIRRMVLKCRLPDEDVEELVHDAVLVLIAAIRKGKFQYQGFHPAAYAVKVAGNLISNKVRKGKIESSPMPEWEMAAGFDPETYLLDKERQLIVERLLEKLGETCRQLIRLKYFENRRDRDIVAESLSGFTTTDSLKSKRNQCMKKLAQMAGETGVTRMFKHNDP